MSTTESERAKLAEQTIGKRVRLRAPLPARLMGETGEVNGFAEGPDSDAVRVLWDLYYADGGERWDTFTPEEFVFWLHVIS